MNPRKCGPQNAWLNRWIAKLASENVTPIMTILECVTPGIWKARERFWISHWRGLNANLLNIQDGGNGAGIIADVTRHRLSVSGTGKKHSDGTKEQMRQSALNRSPETYDHMRGEGNPAKRPEVRKLLSEFQQGENNPKGFLGKRHTAEAKAGMSKNNAMKRPEIAIKFKKPKSEETRAKMRVSQQYRRALALRQATTFGWEDAIAS